MVMSLTANAKKDNPPLLSVTMDLTTHKTFIVPKMHVFRRQSYVIQCILIVMKLSPIGLVQKSVVKAMSVSLATSFISLLISFLNFSL